MSELPPEIDAKYEILEKLGEGGMGAVFEVRHRLLGQPRVVKVIRAGYAGDEKMGRRFRREARAAIELHHPNIAQLHDFEISRDGRAYLVMELIHGLTFQRLMARARPPLPLALAMARQTLAALGYLHSKGYLHRDVSPDNLMLTRSVDGEPRVKLIDLGLAKHNAETLELTATNMFVGKVRYASPELFRRPATEPTPRSDLYSFGVVLYELLTGVCPVQGSSFEELMAAHLLDEPTPFERTDPEGRVPSELRRVVMRSLAKRPDGRFASAEAFDSALEPFHRPEEVPALGEIESLFGCSFLPSARPGQPPDGELDIPTIAAGAPDPGVAGMGEPAAVTAHGRIAARKSHRSDRAGGRGPRRRRAKAPLAARLGLAALGLAAVASAFLLREPAMKLIAGRGPESGGMMESLGDPASRVGSTPAVSQGRILITARPWAEIVEIADSDGRVVSFAGPLHTPALLSLPAGAYTVSVDHPDLPAQRRLEVRVPLTGTVRQELELAAVDVDAYFAGQGLRTLLERAGL
ncbi:MAG: serine/threonine protein kinase [Holophagales bacterium]|nr:serine/threonine protein kinase [Holophagales bacterium]